MSLKPSISCEFFPPKTEKGFANLTAVRQQLNAINPNYYSVTFGAGGTTQDYTLEAIKNIQAESATTGVEAAPHISCVGTTERIISDLISTYKTLGIKRLVALRGDQPSGMQTFGDFRYASELVAFIRQTTGNHFTIEVAAYPEQHPQASSAQADLDHFKRKVDAGADSAITQYFYNIDAYRYFIDRCEQNNIAIPITPGIMPINNFIQLARFSDNCGAEIPRWLRKRLEEFHDDTASLQAFTLDFLTDFAQQLIELDVPGLHFYTMNKIDPVLTVCQRLGLSSKK
jgi:methylenetetrahydrofolate reductase (NADPH)